MPVADLKFKTTRHDRVVIYGGYEWTVPEGFYVPCDFTSFFDHESNPDAIWRLRFRVIPLADKELPDARDC